jgi:hypothetical protein
MSKTQAQDNDNDQMIKQYIISFLLPSLFLVNN